MSDKYWHLPQRLLRLSPFFTGVLTVFAPNRMNISHIRYAFNMAVLYNLCLKHPLNSSVKPF